MYVFYCLLLYTTYSGIVPIECLDETNNFDGNNHYSNTVIFCSTNNCRQYTALIAGSIVGGIIGIILILICILSYYCHRKGRPSQSNSTFLNRTNHKHKFDNTNVFKSGIWSSRYLQLGIWYGPNCVSFLFDSQSFKVTGSGTDTIGNFTMNGNYSIKTNRMALTQIYESDIESQIIIQLIWNNETHQFEGKRYVQTKTYREENKFELKYKKQTQLSRLETV